MCTAGAITSTTTSSRITQSFRLEFKGKLNHQNPEQFVTEAELCDIGLEEVERTLREENCLEQKLTKDWKVSIKIYEPTPEQDEVPDGWVISVDLRPICTSYEYNELCNIWNRKLKWRATLQTLDGSVLYEGNRKQTINEFSRQVGDAAFPIWGWDIFQTRDEVFEHHVVKAEDGFVMIFTLEEIGTETNRLFKDFMSVRLGCDTSDIVACELLDSEAGDVAFEIRKDDNVAVYLYAQKKILAAHSKYFKTRFAAEWDSSDLPVEDGENDRNVRSYNKRRRTAGDRPQNGKTDEIVVIDEPETETSRKRPLSAVDSRADERPKQRTVISVDDVDYTTMHNILYYLYTGRVNLHLYMNEEEAPIGYPDAADPFLLYRAANMYMLKDLEDRCVQYLQSTCTPVNVIERLFDNTECAHHDRIRKLYLEYLNDNFERIKKTKEWEEMLLNMKDCSEELVAYKSRLLLEITSQMSFGAK